MSDIKPMPTTAEGFVADLRTVSTCADVVGMMWASQITAAAAGLIEAQAARIGELERERDGLRSAVEHANHCQRITRDEANEAFDRATAAEAERDRLRAALEPFADFARRNTDEHGWAGTQCQRERICDWFGPTDFRRARAALAHAELSGNPGRLPGEENADAQ